MDPQACPSPPQEISSGDLQVPPRPGGAGMVYPPPIFQMGGGPNT